MTIVSLPCALSAFTLVALILMLPSVLATCYRPNGDVSQENDTPCPNSEACCPPDAFCLSNGLCWTASNFLLRASCSDKSWTSPNCSTYCRNFLPNAGKVMSPCDNSGLFTCDYDTCAKNFSVSKGEVVLRDYQINSLGALATVTVSSNTAASTSISTTSTSISISSSSIPTSSTASTFTSSPPTDATCSNSSSVQSLKLVHVGAGVGIPLTIAVVAALALWSRERRKAKRLELEIARLGGGGLSGTRGIVGYGEPMSYYPNGQAVRAEELTEDRAVYEVMGQPMAHELRTERR